MASTADITAKRSKLSVYCIGFAHAKERHDFNDARQWAARIRKLKQELAAIEKQEM